MTFPRVLGIEAAGVIEAAPGTDFDIGSKAVAMMGGMGRSFDGGYAEYTLVPAACVTPVKTDLDWARLGALPEVLQTAWGSLHVGVGLQAGDSLLVRGGTSSVGLMAAILALAALALVPQTAVAQVSDDLNLSEQRYLPSPHAYDIMTIMTSHGA